jgi:hypothetical protein
MDSNAPAGPGMVNFDSFSSNNIRKPAKVGKLVKNNNFLPIYFNKRLIL